MSTCRPLTLTAVALLLTCGLATAQDEGKPERKRPEGAPNRAEMLKRFDKDGDGKLSETEREAARKTREKQMEQIKERSKQMLEEFDADGDGKLDEDERASAKEAMKAKALEKFDKDEDGELSEKERKAMQETLRKRHQQRGGGEAPEGRRGKEGKGGAKK